MRVRPLHPVDLPRAGELCQRSPAHNLILLSNLTQPAAAPGLVSFWGQFNADDDLAGVLLRYHNLWFYTCEPPGQARLFGPVVAAAGQPSVVLNGSREETLALAESIPGYRVTLDLPSRLRFRTAISAGSGLGPALSVRRAVPDDVAGITAFYADAPADVRRGRESIVRSIAPGRRTFIAEERGEIAACALTTVELPALAMMGGLHARHGSSEALYAVVAELISSLAEDAMGACVVTREPQIDAICDRLDFSDLGPWQILHLTHAGGAP